jgi:hypothetical protein
MLHREDMDEDPSNNALHSFFLLSAENPYNARIMDACGLDRIPDRRTVRMIKGGVIFTLASVDVKAIQEAVMADLVVEYESPDRRRQVDKMLLELLEPYYFSAGLWEGFGLFSMILPSISKSREILETVRRTRGIRSARLELVEDRYEFYDYLYEAVDSKLASLQFD